MPTCKDVSTIESAIPADRLVTPDQTTMIVLRRGKTTITVTCNEPSPAAVESFRSALYQLIMRLIDPSSTL